MRAEHSIRGRSQLAARHARELGSTSVVATISPRLVFFLSVVLVHSSAFSFIWSQRWTASGADDGIWLRSADINDGVQSSPAEYIGSQEMIPARPFAAAPCLNPFGAQNS